MTNAIIENLGGVGEFNFFTQMLAKLRLGLAVMAGAIFFNHRFAPSFEAEQYQVDARKAPKDSQLTPGREKAATIIFIATIAGLVFMSLTGGDSTIPPLIGALCMVFAGVLKPREVPNNMGLQVILCSVGLLPISTALVNTGADVIISDGIDMLLGNTDNPFFVLFVFYFISSVLTQIMYNATVKNIFQPLAIIAAVSHGWSATPLVLAVIIGSSSAMLTPMASNVTALGYNAGKYNMKQYFLGGLFLWIVELVAFMVTVPFMFPLT